MEPQRFQRKSLRNHPLQIERLRLFFPFFDIKKAPALGAGQVGSLKTGEQQSPDIPALKKAPIKKFLVALYNRIPPRRPHSAIQR